MLRASLDCIRSIRTWNLPYSSVFFFSPCTTEKKKRQKGKKAGNRKPQVSNLAIFRIPQGKEKAGKLQKAECVSTFYRRK